MTNEREQKPLPRQLLVAGIRRAVNTALDEGATPFSKQLATILEREALRLRAGIGGQAAWAGTPKDRNEPYGVKFLRTLIKHIGESDAAIAGITDQSVEQVAVFRKQVEDAIRKGSKYINAEGAGKTYKIALPQRSKQA